MTSPSRESSALINKTSKKAASSLLLTTPRSSPRRACKRSRDESDDSCTPPTIATIARRLDFSPVASPSRRAITAQPYSKALETDFGAAARRALSLRAPPARCATSVSRRKQRAPQPVIFFAVPVTQQQQQHATRQTRVSSPSPAEATFAADLKVLHPLLEPCAALLRAAGLGDLHTLRTLNAEDLDHFLAAIPQLTTLQRSLLKSRAHRAF